MGLKWKGRRGGSPVSRTEPIASILSERESLGRPGVRLGVEEVVMRVGRRKKLAD